MAKKGGLPHTKISKLFFVVSRDLILQLGEGIGLLVETLGLCQECLGLLIDREGN